MTTEQELLNRLNQLREISLSLSREHNTTRLLEAILLAAKDLTKADGGTLYRRHGDYLTFEIMRTDSLGLFRGGTSGEPIKLNPIPLYRDDGSPNDSLVVAYSVLHDQAINVPDAYEATGQFDFTGPRQFDRLTGYRSQSFLAVPMKNHEEEIIGVLQLINAKDPRTGETVSFGDEDQLLAEAFASQAAIALTNHLLIEQLKNLFESFVRLINTAIDEKSPYTGGHCARVPELTLMLAEAAAKPQTEGGIALSLTAPEMEELRLAAMLHDCGKITTPVHVVDKATKLETIYDRIHEIDTRFEVLKRDVEIETLKAQRGTSPEEAALLDEACKQRLAQLDEEREYLRVANWGGEFMSAEAQERVREIGSRKWRGPEGQEIPLLSEEEIGNLTIAKGTLTAAEREIINYHIVATIKMLEALPWPKQLSRVPEYAGGHHERMDGRGYPKGLRREQMSVPARIMGIADIFEALTAKDRPYKPGKTLSEALAILGRMRLDNHVDPDLFDVFVRQKVYLRYAENFLDPEQIDDVNDKAIPGYVP